MGCTSGPICLPHPNDCVTLACRRLRPIESYQNMSHVAVSLVSWLTRLGEFLSSGAMKFGGAGIFLLAVSDSSFVTIPEGNDVLIVLLSSGNSWGRMGYYVAITILGSVTGCMLLYTVGRRGGSPLLRSRFSVVNVQRAESLFARYGLLTVVIPSLLPPPCPFKIFVLSAGVFRLNAVKFAMAVALGRTMRYSMWGILAVLYGNPVKQYMQHNLPKTGIVLFGLFLLLVAATALYYRYSSRRRKGRGGPAA